MSLFDNLQTKFMRLWPELNERSRRLLAATEAKQIGYGGLSLVSRACGLSRVIITKVSVLLTPARQIPAAVASSGSCKSPNLFASTLLPLTAKGFSKLIATLL